MAGMEDILAALEPFISECLLMDFSKSSIYKWTDPKRVLDVAETAEPEYMVWGGKRFCGQNKLESIGIPKSNQCL